MIDYAALARLGVATVHEAAGRTGVVDIALTQVVPGSRVGRTRANRACAPGDNTMVHALIAHANQGDVLVLTSVEPAPVALIGDLLATQAQVRAASPGSSSTVPCATSTSSSSFGLPIWTRFVRAQGATKGEVESSTSPSSSAGPRSGRAISSC